MNSLYLIFCGLCMGAADLCPGISGGTIAYIMGFYSDFLLSIKSIRLKKLFYDPHFKFLAKILTGMLLSICLLAPFFDHILNKEVERSYLYSIFFGLILGSICLSFREIYKFSTSLFFALLFGLVIGFSLTSLDLSSFKKEKLYDVPFSLQTSSNLELVNYNFDKNRLENISESTILAMESKGLIPKKTLLYDRSEKREVTLDSLSNQIKNFWLIDLSLVFAGALAVSALLLPGISGSYMLTILGLYGTAISALADFIHSIKSFTFDFDAFFILFNLSLGIVFGALLFSRVVLFLLSHYKNLTQSVMVGIMIGALPTVWPFWSYLYKIDPLKPAKGILLIQQTPLFPSFSASVAFSIFLILLGFSLVLTIHSVAKRKLALNSGY